MVGEVPPVRRTNVAGKGLAARKGQWSPRGTGTTVVLACPCPTASRYRWLQGVSARVTGKAGENGQNSASWEAAHPGQDRTSKASAQGGDQELVAPGSLSTWVTGRSYSLEWRLLNVQSGLRRGWVVKTSGTS